MSKNIKRLGIFCFYDCDGEVDCYIEYLLKDFKTVLSELIVVVNGNINEEGKVRLNKYADCFVIRENLGFDFGAYYEVLTQRVGERLRDFDELILCNDTFYGPFVSFKEIIERMQAEDCDFWGLNLVEDSFLTHIQSYFLTFRKEVLQSDVLYEFFHSESIESLVQTKDVMDIYAIFEVGLFRYLIQKGYKYATYTNTKEFDIYQSPDICMIDYALPILKKKSFDRWCERKDALMRALCHIERIRSYDMSYIKESIKRRYGIETEWDDTDIKEYKMALHDKKHELISENGVLEFIEKHTEIYIYGSGIYARKIWYIFGNGMERFCGFIVSDDVTVTQSNLYGYPIWHYKDVQEGSSIIIGCDYKNTREICSNVRACDVICEIWKKG